MISEVANWNPKKNERGISGLTAGEFRGLYNKKTNYTQPYGTNYAPLVFDATWAIAIALNTTQQKIVSTGRCCLRLYMEWIYLCDELIYVSLKILL